MKSTDDVRAYDDSSAIHWTQNIRSPLMVIHGINDVVALFMDSVSLVRKMIAEGKDVCFVVLPEAAHAWDMGPANQTVYAFKQMVDFFNRHLK